MTHAGHSHTVTRRASRSRDLDGIGTLERLVLSEIDQLYPPPRASGNQSVTEFVDALFARIHARADRVQVLDEVRNRLKIVVPEPPSAEPADTARVDTNAGDAEAHEAQEPEPEPG